MIGLVFRVTAMITPLVQAQDTALLTAAMSGEVAARNRLAPIAREARVRALEAGDNAALWRLAAQTHRAMAGALSPSSAPDWTMEEKLWRPGYIEALRGIASSDSGDLAPLAELNRLAPYPLLWLQPRQELEHLRAARARGAILPAALAIVQLRLELEAGDSAGVATALANLPTTTSPAQRAYLTAEVAFARGDALTGAREYRAGVRLIVDSADLHLYGEQVEWIATGDEVLDWRGVSPSHAAAWLDRFWTDRDAADVRTAGSRLAEQFRRWRVALKRYRWSSDGWAASHPPFVEVVDGSAKPPGVQNTVGSGLHYLVSPSPGSQVLDDRGGMVMRHGEPLPATEQPGIGSQDAATLGWATASGTLLLGFSRPTLPGGQAGQSFRLGMLVRGFPQGDLLTNCHQDPRLCVLAGLQAQAGAASIWGATAIAGEQVREDFERMRLRANRTDGNPLQFDRRLEVIAQVYGVAGGRLLIVLSLPADEVFEAKAASGSPSIVGVRIKVSARQHGTTEGLVTLDTIRYLRATKPNTRNSYLSLLTEIPVPIGLWDVTVVASDEGGDRGGGSRVADVPVVAFGREQLALGDPILGRGGSGLKWDHEGQLVALNPTGAWHRNEPAILYYELGGLRAGAEYEYRVELWDTASAATMPRLRIGFRERASASIERKERELNIAQLKPGSYRLVLTVLALSGEVVSRERRLEVR